MLRCNIALHGPSEAGKATCLRSIADRLCRGALPTSRRVDGATMLEHDGPTGLSVAALPLHARISALTGVVDRWSARANLVRGIDGLLLVYDAREQRLDANLEQHDALDALLGEQGVNAARLPTVIVYNRCDDPGALPLVELRPLLNPRGHLDHATVATSAEGVWPAFRALLSLVVRSFSA